MRWNEYGPLLNIFNCVRKKEATHSVTPASVLIDTHCGFIFNVFCESSSEQRISAKCNLCVFWERGTVSLVRPLFSLHWKKTHKKNSESTSSLLLGKHRRVRHSPQPRRALLCRLQTDTLSSFALRWWEVTSTVGSTRLLAVLASW